MAKLLKKYQDFSLFFGATPETVMENCGLKAGPRALFPVLDSFGQRQVPFSALLKKVGLAASSKQTLIRWLVQLVQAGLLEVESGRGQMGNRYFLQLPPWMLVSNPIEARRLKKQAYPVNRLGWPPAGKPAHLVDGKLVGDWPAQQYLDKVRKKLFESFKKVENHLKETQTTTFKVVEQPPALKTKHESTPEGENLKGAKIQPPPGWQDWKNRVENRTGRLFFWTPDQVKLAQEIAVLLNGNLDWVDQVQKNFLRDDFWVNRLAPLAALKKNLLDYSPKIQVSKPRKAANLATIAPPPPEFFAPVDPETPFLQLLKQKDPELRRQLLKDAQLVAG